MQSTKSPIVRVTFSSEEEDDDDNDDVGLTILVEAMFKPCFISSSLSL